MKKLKILHTTTRLVRGGGVENNIYQTISRLRGEYDFHLGCGVDFQMNPFEKFPEVKIIICPHMINKISPWKDLKSLWFFYRLIKKEKYDIVHTHETKASLITRLAAWLAGCPCIIYGLHGVTFNDPMGKLKRSFYIAIEKYTVWVSDLIVSVSHDVMHHYHKNKIGVKIPYHVVRSGVDMEEFFQKHQVTNERKKALKQELGFQEENIVITNVGRFSFSKAQRYTLEVFARLHKEFPQTRLLLVGEGELLEECKEQARKSGIEKSVVFTGYTSAVAELLSITDLFMFTSLREGLPRVTVEASLIKVPVVAFEVEGVREVVKDGYSGYIVAQYDVESLYQRAKELLQDSAKRIQFGQRAHEHVRTEWDAVRMAEQLGKIYQECRKK